MLHLPSFSTGQRVCTCDAIFHTFLFSSRSCLQFNVGEAGLKLLNNFISGGDSDYAWNSPKSASDFSIIK